MPRKRRASKRVIRTTDKLDQQQVWELAHGTKSADYVVGHIRPSVPAWPSRAFASDEIRLESWRFCREAFLEEWAHVPYIWAEEHLTPLLEAR